GSTMTHLEAWHDLRLARAAALPALLGCVDLRAAPRDLPRPRLPPHAGAERRGRQGQARAARGEGYGGGEQQGRARHQSLLLRARAALVHRPRAAPALAPRRRRRRRADGVRLPLLPDPPLRLPRTLAAQGARAAPPGAHADEHRRLLRAPAR